jgi:CBS domain-containing protein
VAVLVFNLVPAFPLDGGRVLRSILWAVTDNLRRATYWASQIGQGFAVFLIATGVFQFLAGFVIQGLWLGLIGLFLSNAARGGYQRVLIRQALQGEPVGRFMTANPIVVEPWVDLRTWVEDYVYRHHRKFFPVVSDGIIEGVITTQSLAKYSQQEWGKRTVAEAMERNIEPLSISPGADALQALGQIEHTGSSRLLVVEEGRLIGIISLKDLLRFLNIKLELDDIPAGCPERRDTSLEADRRVQGRPPCFRSPVFVPPSQD